jgi:MFS family permease
MLAFGGIIVPKVNLILTLICRDYLEEVAARDPSFSFMPVIDGADNPQCRIPEVQALVARYTLYGNLMVGILSAIVSPKMGALSDRYGRLRLICFCASGALIGEIITIVVATHPDAFSVYVMLLGYVTDGLCGSMIAAIALIHSYAADVTPPSRRNVTFGYFHGALFTGIGFGPMIGGYVTKKSDSLITVFYIAIVCHLIFLFSCVFIIPESLSKQRQRVAREKHKSKSLDVSEFIGPTVRSWLTDLRNFRPFAPLKILWPTGPGSQPALRRNLFVLATIDTAMFGVAMGTMTIIVIYSEFMFGWGNYESSIFVSLVNICRVCMLIIVLPGITRLVRGPVSSRTQQKQSGSDGLDVWVIRIAIIFDMMGYIGYSVSRTGPVFLVSGMVASLGGMGSPTVQSSLTKHVPPDRTGQLLGAIGLLHALARVVSPTIFNLIYASTVGKFSQTVFVCLASVFGVAFVISWFVRPHGEFPFHTHSAQGYDMLTEVRSIP